MGPPFEKQSGPNFQRVYRIRNETARSFELSPATTLDVAPTTRGEPLALGELPSVAQVSEQ